MSNRFPPKSFTWLGYPDPYKTLGVDRRTSSKEIHARHRELSRTWHPDKAGRFGVDQESANLITRIINDAGQILKNDNSRGSYDGRNIRIYGCRCDLCVNCNLPSGL